MSAKLSSYQAVKQSSSQAATVAHPSCQAVKLPSCSCCTSKLASWQATKLSTCCLPTLSSFPCHTASKLQHTQKCRKNATQNDNRTITETIMFWQKNLLSKTCPRHPLAAKLLSWSQKRQATSWTACSKTQMLLQLVPFTAASCSCSTAAADAAAASSCCFCCLLLHRCLLRFAASFPCC